MDVRSYDPSIARWTSVDPVTHHSFSTYNAFDNNPVYWADPSGADAVQDEDGWTFTGKDAVNVFNAVKEIYGSGPGDGDKKKKTKKEGESRRRRVRQRSRNRSRVGSGSFWFDARGQELLSHWLSGSGEDLELDSKNWQDYMRSNEKLTGDIIWEIGDVMEKDEKTRNKLKKTGKLDFNVTFHGEIENGYFTGYQMLHGTHSGLGDLQVKGTIYYNSKTGNSRYEYEATWNDKIDPNASYSEDVISSKILKVLYSPANYNVKIRWKVKENF